MQSNIGKKLMLAEILDLLKDREPIFYRPELGTTRDDFEAMIDADFCEVGASGRCYSREFVIKTLLERVQNPLEESAWQTMDFKCVAIANDHYLLTYQLIQGERITRRATIWRYIDNTWKIFYHQGTIVQTPS